jgi:hypothetical protein
MKLKIIHLGAFFLCILFSNQTFTQTASFKRENYIAVGAGFHVVSPFDAAMNSRSGFIQYTRQQNRWLSFSGRVEFRAVEFEDAITFPDVPSDRFLDISGVEPAAFQGLFEHDGPNPGITQLSRINTMYTDASVAFYVGITPIQKNRFRLTASVGPYLEYTKHQNRLNYDILKIQSSVAPELSDEYLRVQWIVENAYLQYSFDTNLLFGYKLGNKAFLGLDSTLRFLTADLSLRRLRFALGSIYVAPTFMLKF